MEIRQKQAWLNGQGCLRVRFGAVVLLSSVAIGGLAGCSLVNSANVIENIDEAAGVKEDEPGSVNMPIGDIFDSEYERVIIICPGATERDVLAASDGTWQSLYDTWFGPFLPSGTQPSPQYGDDEDILGISPTPEAAPEGEVDNR